MQSEREAAQLKRVREICQRVVDGEGDSLKLAEKSGSSAGFGWGRGESSLAKAILAALRAPVAEQGAEPERLEDSFAAYAAAPYRSRSAPPLSAQEREDEAWLEQQDREWRNAASSARASGRWAEVGTYDLEAARCRRILTALRAARLRAAPAATQGWVKGAVRRMLAAAYMAGWQGRDRGDQSPHCVAWLDSDGMRIGLEALDAAAPAPPAQGSEGLAARIP